MLQRCANDALSIMTSIHFHPCSKLVLRANWRPVALVSSAGVLRPEGCAGPSIRLPQRTKQASSAAHRSHRSRTMTVMSAKQDADGDQAFTLVGSGRVGTALAKLGTGSDVFSSFLNRSICFPLQNPTLVCNLSSKLKRVNHASCTHAHDGVADCDAIRDVQKVVERGQPVDGPPGPIIVCTRNNDLQGVLDSTPKERREDLVFIQNGMLQPWLDARGLGSNTQALVYFAVSKKGETPIDGKTDANPEGLTAVTGKHAQAFAGRLAHGDLSCKVLDGTQYKKSMLEKLIWISAVMLVGTKNGNIKVGEVEKYHKDELSTLIGELASAGEAELGVQLDGGILERLLAYSRSVASFPTAVKEVPWRNGWFYDISLQAQQEGKDDPCSTHSAWLKEVGAVS